MNPTQEGPRRALTQYLGTTDTSRFDPSFDLYGGGGLASTVSNLVRFYKALFGGQVFKHPATLSTMLGKPRSTRPADLGMAIFSETIGHATCWHHDGFWGTTVIHCPGTHVTLAITVNQADNFDSAVQHLTAAVLRLVSRT